MIQRIQSLYLFIGAVLLSVCIFMPLWKGAVAIGTTVTFDAFSISTRTPSDVLTEIENTSYIGIGLIITVLLSLFIIMQFKNRTLQIRLSLLNAFLILLVTGLMFWAAPTDILQRGGNGDFTLAFFFPAISAMLNLLAMRAIKKDEELVRSADRIR